MHNDNLHATERLILAHIAWRVSMIADEETIMTLVANAHEEGVSTHQRYSKYLPSLTEPEDDDEYSQYGGRSPSGY